MQNTEQILQFHLIKDELKRFAKTELGKEYASSLVAFDTKEETLIQINALKEMLNILGKFGSLPIAFSINALPLIKHAKKGGILTERDLDMIAEDVLTSMALIKFLNKVDDNATYIKNKAKEFVDLTSLEKEIHRVINKSQVVDDKASKELYEIRQQIAACEKKLSSQVLSIAYRYKDYLSDESVTIRDGHYVLPVKTTLKNKVKGIIYDISDSGFTTFIEPNEIVQLNNDIITLKIREADEVKRLLKMLTQLVALEEESIMNNNLIIGYFDFLMAKGLYANENDGIIPSYNEENIIYFKSAAHPLIDRNKIVRNSFYFDANKKIIIISGPNAGGKTVALKTVGILCYMFKCGLALPVREGNICYINNIYVDIGDSQSISDNLSTFSAHITNVSEICNKANKNDLILIDELGTGTDPLEGEALAIAIVKHLLNKDCLALISSHFSRLKEFAFTSNKIDNASMLFDETNLSPTYMYKQGVPGQSYALDVASRYNLNEKIISDAKTFLADVKSSDVNELMNELHKAALENEVNRLEVEKLRKELDKERKIFEADKNLLKEKREKLLESVNLEKEQIIEDAKDKVDEILKLLNKEDIKQHEIIEAKKALDDLAYKESVIDYNEKIEVNDYVSVPSLSLRGKVNKINGNKAHLISDGGMSFTVDIKKLHKIDTPSKKKIQNVFVDDKIMSKSVGLELNIIGKRYEEAKVELEKYLDTCRIKKLKQVRIIHGLGTGALKRMTHEYLKSANFIDSFRLGNEYEGGMGATIVILK